MRRTTPARLRRLFADANTERVNSLLRRAEIQTSFAKALRELLPNEETVCWVDAIDRASARLESLDRSGGVEALEAAVAQMEADLAPVGAKAKTYTIHCVGHGHIDMNWMWSWPETCAATHDTFASVLSLMERYPQFTYTQSQASVYALTERYSPELFEKIRRRVEEGRWEVAAVQWVEGDKNLAHGESLARHVLHTRAYFAGKLGLRPDDCVLDWEPDTFGHANTVPAILSQGGVRYYYACRPGGGQGHPRTGDERPLLFNWQAPDGSRVLVNREGTWYNSYVNIGDDIAAPMLEFSRATGLTHWMNVYGIGNHGGGPTRDEIDYYLELQTWPVYPKVIFSTAHAFFRAVEAEIAERGLSVPVIDHELNYEFTGCYTSQSLIKQANRFGENYCLEAETMAALAGANGYEPPEGLLREAWINVLFNQFHDILPGSGVRQTREHALGLFQETAAITGTIKRLAGEALVARIDTLSLLPDGPEGAEERERVADRSANTPYVAGAGIAAMERGMSQGSSGGKRFRPFVVYNPCPFPRTELVTVDLYDMAVEPGLLVARDEEGKERPVQFLERGHDWGHDKVTVAFAAYDVPPLGYRTYLIGEGEANAANPAVRIVEEGVFETPYLRAKFDRELSGLKELVDLRNGVDASSGCESLGQWESVVERGRGMSAWVLGSIVEPAVPLRATRFQIKGARRNEGTDRLSGEALAVRVHSLLEVPGTKSTVDLRTTLHGLSPRVEFEATVDWREIGDPERGIPGLRVSFETALNIGDGEGVERCETPFGSVTRCSEGTGAGWLEAPTLRYVSLFGPSHGSAGEPQNAGVTLLQDCKYGHELQWGRIGMRVVRSSFDPDHAPEVSRHTVRYALVLHYAEPAPSELTRLGMAWNHPLIILPVNLQAGERPPREGFVEVRGEGVVLTALKRAEGSRDLIVRFVDYDGAGAAAEVEFHPDLLGGRTRAALVDLMERPVEGEAALEGRTLRLRLPKHGFATVRLS
jgi:alpha-mannosidase